MRHVGPISLVLTIAFLVGFALATGERGYCRMVHLVIKPVGFALLTIWLIWWQRRAGFAEWRPWQKAAWIGLFAGVFAIHVYGALFEAPGFCERPACAEAHAPGAWLTCLAMRWTS